MNTIVMGNDHAGLDLKNHLKAALEAEGFTVIDQGTDGTASVDYPDFAVQVAEIVATAASHTGILVCGTGIGMSMTANRVPGIRAALCHTEYEARATRQHNDANILCLGSRVLGVDQASAVMWQFLRTSFEGGRHQRRIDKIDTVTRRA